MRDITDKELIYMLSTTGLQESKGVDYLLHKNLPIMRKYIYIGGGTDEDAYTVINDAAVILITNIRKNKFKGQSRVNTYFVGICKLLWKNRLHKHYKRLEKVQDIDNKDLENFPELNSAIERFEKLNENKVRLERVYGLITGNCKNVLSAWAAGYSMKEIAIKQGYKNAQIAMNKKNTCLKAVIQRIQNENIKN